MCIRDRTGAKIGAIHSVVYGGFSVEALYDRILDSNSKVLVTCDGAWLRGEIVELKKIVNEALLKNNPVQSVIVVKRTGQAVEMVADRDHWYHDLMALPIADPKTATEHVETESPLFLSLIHI